AETLRQLHPNRLQHTLFSDRNPWMHLVKEMAEYARQHRRPVATDNAILELERAVSRQIERTLDTYRDVRDRATERTFSAIYGSPWLQAKVGLRAAIAERSKVRPSDGVFESLVAQKVESLRARIGDGGLREATLRILLYVGSDEARVDVRAF